MKITKLLLIIFLALLIQGIGLNDAKALNLTFVGFVLTYDQLTGAGSYDYILTNSGISDGSITEFTIYFPKSKFPLATTFTGFTAAAGFVSEPLNPFSLLSDFLVTFTSAGGLAPGLSLSGFRIDFLLSPGAAQPSWIATFYDLQYGYFPKNLFWI